MTATHVGSVYSIHMRANLPSRQIANIAMAVTTKPSNLLTLWHRRLSHVDSATVRQIAKLKYHGVSLGGNEVDDFCEACVKGKAKRFPFPRYTSARSTQVLDLVHIDLVGPLRTPTFGQCCYFFTILDDFTNCVFTFPMKTKSEFLAP